MHNCLLDLTLCLDAKQLPVLLAGLWRTCRDRQHVTFVPTHPSHSLVFSQSLRAASVIEIHRHSFTHQETWADKDTQLECWHTHPRARVLTCVRWTGPCSLSLASLALTHVCNQKCKVGGNYFRQKSDTLNVPDSCRTADGAFTAFVLPTETVDFNLWFYPSDHPRLLFHSHFLPFSQYKHPERCVLVLRASSLCGTDTARTPLSCVTFC